MQLHVNCLFKGKLMVIIKRHKNDTDEEKKEEITRRRGESTGKGTRKECHARLFPRTRNCQKTDFLRETKENHLKRLSGVKQAEETTGNGKRRREQNGNNDGGVTCLSKTEGQHPLMK